MGQNNPSLPVVFARYFSHRDEKSHRELGTRGRALALAIHFHVLYVASAGSANLPTCPTGQKFARFLRCSASKRSHFAVVVEISEILWLFDA